MFVEANRSHANRSLRMHRDLSRGTMTITADLPLEAGELIDKALDRARESSLCNLLLLCTRHHRLVHEGGFSIAKDYLDRWYFRRPDGIAVPDCGYRLGDTTDDDVNVNDASLIECPSAEGLSAAEGLPRLPLNVAERDPTAEALPTLPLSVAERTPPPYLMQAKTGVKLRTPIRTL